MDLKNNITVVWDGGKIGLDIPQNFEATFPDYQLFGLVGTYNNNTADDFMGPDGKKRKSAKDFGDSWAVPGSCKQDDGNKSGQIYMCFTPLQSNSFILCTLSVNCQ